MVDSILNITEVHHVNSMYSNKRVEKQLKFHITNWDSTSLGSPNLLSGGGYVGQSVFLGKYSMLPKAVYEQDLLCRHIEACGAVF